MLFLLLVLVLATVVGRLVGGRLRRIADLPIRSTWLVGAAFGVQILGALAAALPATAARVAYGLALAVSAALVAAFLARNWGLAGIGLVTVGLTLNALVVAVNGAMPVSAVAAGRAGVSTQHFVDASDPRHRLAGPGTTLSWLGDVLPAPLPWRPEVLSPGDLLLASGLALLVVSGMRGRYGGRRRAPRPWLHDALTSSRGSNHGEEGTQAPGPGQAQGQPRQAPQQLTGGVPPRRDR